MPSGSRPKDDVVGVRTRLGAVLVLIFGMPFMLLVAVVIQARDARARKRAPRPLAAGIHDWPAILRSGRVTRTVMAEDPAVMSLLAQMASMDAGSAGHFSSPSSEAMDLREVILLPTGYGSPVLDLVRETLRHRYRDDEDEGRWRPLGLSFDCALIAEVYRVGLTEHGVTELRSAWLQGLSASRVA